MKFRVVFLSALLWTLGTIALDGPGSFTFAQTNAQSPPEPPAARQSTASQAAPPQDASAQTAAASVPTDAASVRALLYKIYNLAYHAGSQADAFQPGSLKMSGRSKAALLGKAHELSVAVSALHQPWDVFYKNTTDASAGRATDSALKELISHLKDFSSALADSPGASAAPDYSKPAAELSDLEGQLAAYIGPSEGQGQTTAPAEQPSAAAPAPSSSAASSPPAASAPANSQSTPPQPVPSQPAATRAAPAASAAQAGSGQTQPPASAASSTVPEQAPSTPVTPVAMAPADVQALLYKIYLANFRIGDLTSSLQPGAWKLSDQDRAAFAQRTDALQAAVAAVKKSRDDFYGSPADAELGRATVAAIQALLPELGNFINALKSSPGTASAKDYEQASADLSGLESQLEPYVAYLEAKENAPGKPGAALQTEEVNAAPPAAPIGTASAEKAPLNHDDLKALLYQAYAPAFRIKDLLAQERPDAWKASDADRSVFRSASEELGQKLAELEKWRAELDQRPDSLEAAFEVYAALGDLTQPADAVGRIASQFDGAAQGAEYVQKAQQVAGLRGQVEPYLGYLLRRSDAQAGTVERNFVACEKELSSSMRPTTPAAEPMKNVLPVFKGRGKSVARGKGRESTAHGHEKKAAKPTTSKPTGR